MARKVAQIEEALEVLQAETLVATVRLRNALIKKAEELLPEAIEQCKPQRAGKDMPARPGSPALLRLITRLATNSAMLSKSKPKK